MLEILTPAKGRNNRKTTDSVNLVWIFYMNIKM